MVYRMRVGFHCEICPETGKPFVWSSDGMRLYISLEDYVMPTEYLGWACATGNHLAAYIPAEVANSYGTTLDGQTFLDNFPEWESINCEGTAWTEEDHNNFLDFAIYLSNRPGYVLSWSF